ncbi:Rrf2 family transcriptional regulator [Paenibacillus spiritus]|uniref:Rrf2 family transcriptional regulator n=1 Tax=Paenibacillus spiritus TaxID=2496557 RepID=A0A5J5FVK0_9BACL|nr:Rrf2 family transcriptional regulator [Paenibacillus spiritus]KAA8997581.1 Rrf2 family transcriptional regulator [Paenibacillus spiritus]
MQMKTGVEQAVYALLLLSLLPDKAVLPGEAIGSRLGGSPTYMQKLLRRLVDAGLVQSSPGAKGGFRLKREPQAITVYDVYLAVEGRQSLFAPRGTLEDMLERPRKEGCSCRLSGLMDEAEASWRSILGRETIASLADSMCGGEYREEMNGLRLWVNNRSRKDEIA